MRFDRIENLLYEYALRIDSGDLAGVAELFRDGRVETGQGDGIGYDGVLKMYSATVRLYEDGTPRTLHQLSNLQIEQDGDEAECHSCFCVLQALPDFPLQAIITGRYRDRLRRVDGQWQFVSKRITPLHIGDMSRHVLFDAGTLQQAD